MDAATHVDLNEWKAELQGQQEFFDQIGDSMPKTLRLTRELLLARIEAAQAVRDAERHGNESIHPE